MRDREAGLTLIETLIVLSIVAIMAGVTVLSLGVLDRRADAAAEAARLADRLGLASDIALVSGTPLALAWDPRGYRFLAWAPDQATWTAAASPLLEARHDLAPALRLERVDAAGSAPMLISPDLPAPPSVMRLRGANAPWDVTFDGVSAVATPGSG